MMFLQDGVRRRSEVITEKISMEYAKNRDKNYSWAIDFIKCLAVFLVLNNHMKEIYPMSSLTFGGALGNALFFVVSGYMWSNLNNKFFLLGIHERSSVFGFYRNYQHCLFNFFCGYF